MAKLGIVMGELSTGEHIAFDKNGNPLPVIGEVEKVNALFRKLKITDGDLTEGGKAGKGKKIQLARIVRMLSDGTVDVKRWM